MNKTALEKSREVWKGKSDDWLFERLSKELRDKVDEIHLLLHRITCLEAEICDCEDYNNGLVSNSCKIHNDNPIERDSDYPNK